MKRTSLIEKLNNYTPTDQEKIAKDRILRFMHDNPDCFERSLESGHMTASCWLLNKDGSRALLLYHAKLDKWLQLGGHCDGNPDTLAVALQEAQEESGIMNIVPVSGSIFDIDVHLVPANGRDKTHYHYDIRYLLKIASDEEPIQNRESKGFR